MLILRLKLFAVSATCPQALVCPQQSEPLGHCHQQRASPVQVSCFFFFVFFLSLKCHTFNRSALCMVCTYTPSVVFLNTTSNMAARYNENNFGAKTQPCLTPVETRKFFD